MVIYKSLIYCVNISDRDPGFLTVVICDRDQLLPEGVLRRYPKRIIDVFLSYVKCIIKPFAIFDLRGNCRFRCFRSSSASG